MKLTKAQEKRMDELAKTWAQPYYGDTRKLDDSCNAHYRSFKAGYQAGLNDPSVKGLVDLIKDAVNYYNDQTADWEPITEGYQETIGWFREALKEFEGEE